MKPNFCMATKAVDSIWVENGVIGTIKWSGVVFSKPANVYFVILW